jgi:hypothetical protein
MKGAVNDRQLSGRRIAQAFLKALPKTGWDALTGEKTSTRCGLNRNASPASPGFTACQHATCRRTGEAIAGQLAVGKRFAASMRLARLA